MIVATAPSVEDKEPERAIQTVCTISGAATTLNHQRAAQKPAESEAGAGPCTLIVKPSAELAADRKR